MDSPVATIEAIADGVATVTVSRTIACARCAAGKGCGAGLLSGKSKFARLLVPAPTSMQLQAGDQVRLELSPQSLLKASYFVYGLPLLGVVIALLSGLLLVGPLTDAAAIALAVVGLVTGLVTGRMHINRDQCLAQFVPRIAGRLTSS